MLLVNETQQEVSYHISCEGVEPQSGTIVVNGLADLPAFDHQTNVEVQFTPAGEPGVFQIEINDTHSREQVEMALVVL